MKEYYEIYSSKTSEESIKELIGEINHLSSEILLLKMFEKISKKEYENAIALEKLFKTPQFNTNN